MSKPTNKRKDPLILRVIQVIFWVSERVLPGFSERWALKLFLTPPKFPTPEAERIIADQAEKSIQELAGHRVRVYEWGKGDRTILFMHGWAGRASQCYRFVPELIQRGYRIVSFDAPAHGHDPEQNQTNIVEMCEVLTALFKKQQGPVNLMSHSLGGGVVFLAIHRGVRPNRLVTISSPSRADLLLEEFQRRINATDRIGKAIDRQIEEKMGHPIRHFSAEHTTLDFPSDIPYLNIHDTDDKEAEYEHAHVLAKNIPQMKHIKTNGLGHTRILRNDEVLSSVVSFLTD